MSTNVKIGLGIPLTILFLGLKLTHYINWSYWYVLMPIYIVPAILLSVMLGAFLLALTVTLVTK